MNKLSLILSALALVLSGYAVFGGGHALGGTTNYDNLVLGGTSGVTNVLSVGSTTLSTAAEADIDSAATTTLLITSSSATNGGCIQIESPGGGSLFMYATSSPSVAVWQTGTCK